jgi:glycerophosphoryl diester phosphodiesterase
MNLEVDCGADVALRLQIDVKIFSVPDEIFPLMHDVISSYPSYETELSPRLILGLWHPLFIAPANRYLPSLTKFHIGLSTHLARKYFWDLDGFSIAMPMLTSQDGQKFLRDCKAAGKGIMTWTVNDGQDMRVAARKQVSQSNRIPNLEQRSGAEHACSRFDKWEEDPSVLEMGMLERLRWSWSNWKHYSIPQVGLAPSSSTVPELPTRIGPPG